MLMVYDARLQRQADRRAMSFSSKKERPHN